MRIVRAHALLACAVAVALACPATVTTVIDLLDGSDDGAPSPPGIIVADVYADVHSGAGNGAWTACGIYGDARSGAQLRYAHDPNSGVLLPLNPGTADRFVTFLSRPRGRNANGRFRNGEAGIAGGYIHGATASFFPTRVDVAFFASPPVTLGSPPIAGYVFRVALDVTGVTIPGGPFPNSAYRIFPVGQQPAGFVPVFLSNPGQGDLGTVNATFDAPAVTGLNWGVYVPEPTGLALFVLAALAIRRR